MCVMHVFDHCSRVTRLLLRFDNLRLSFTDVQ
jgi:hypothetical protein